MTTIRAHFDGRTIVLDEPADLPVNTPLRLQVEREDQSGGGTAAELAQSGLFGIWAEREDIGESAAFARKLRVEGETRRHEIDDPS